jgi:hypothetical protein
MITLVNPDTGVVFDFDGQWQRTSPATAGDVRRGLAHHPGEKVFLKLPPGVQAQFDRGALVLASEYDARRQLPGAAGVAPLPRGNASHETWISYAVSQGMDRPEAVSLTRDQLKARFADPHFDPDAPPGMELLNTEA